MKQSKKWIGIFLVILSLMLASPALAAEESGAGAPPVVTAPSYEAGTLALEEDVSGSCGSGLTWKLTTAGALTISGSGAMDDYTTTDHAPWYGYRDSIVSVTIGNDVTSIGANAFSGCNKLTTLTIGSGVTYIGDGAFSGCSALKSITIPDSVTEIGKYAFSGCSALAHVVIGDGVTSLNGFDFGSSLVSIVIGNGVTSIGYSAFNGCTALESITIPDNVTSIGDYAFSGCTALASITIPDSVTSIDSYTFCNCTALKSITIPDTVTSIGDWAFDDCGSLTTVYYFGSEDQWRAIEIGRGNYDLTGANIIFNVESAPLGTPVLTVSNDPKTGKVVLSWTAVKDAEKSEIWACTTKDGKYSRIGTVDTTTVSHSSGAVGKTYYYKIRAIAGDTKGSACSPKSGIRDLARPSVTAGNNTATGKVVLKWSAITGATRYEVWCATSENGTYTKLGTIAGTSVAHSSAQSGVTYFYKVRAIASVSGADSAFSAIKSVTVK